jgi:4-alpha-glucanotransferase
VEWTDARGRPQEVKPDTLKAVLKALGYPADTRDEISNSHHRLERAAKAIPRLIASQGRETVHVGATARARVRSEDGEWRDLTLEPLKVGGSAFRAPEAYGYYELELDDSQHILAVAPPRCFSIPDTGARHRLAALSVQLYSLRGGHSEGFGDFAALGEFAAETAQLGLDAIAVSPTHARFAADPGRISPYGPSSRFFLDPLYADPALAGGDVGQDTGGDDLIDWTQAHRVKYVRLRSAYDRFLEQNQHNRSFRTFCQMGGQRLFDHAVYEALDAHFRALGKISPVSWPGAFRDPQSREVHDFAEREKREIAFHLFLQWLAAQSADAAHARAKENMTVGIIADMAVGVDRHGSHAWSAPQELLGGLSVGAPPDVFNPAGQDWGLITYSPTSLKATGYESFIATLRASMQHAGGIRIDHAMGLRRLWLLPEGASPSDGVYVSYPFTDLLRLIALESNLHRNIVIGEDLGTVPEGFRSQIASAGVLGMRVLWFERTRDGRFIQPEHWDFQAAALTTTHDLPTVAGWWTGRDIDWSAKLRRKTQHGGENAERKNRKQDRTALWSALTRSGCSRGPEPAPDNPEPVIDGTLSFVGRTPSMLAIATAEDVLGLPEQPNLPGTTDQHPNWRRRLPAEDMWRDGKARARLAAFAEQRKR